MDREISFSVIDVLTLTQFVYEQDNYELDELVDGYFNGTFEIVSRSDSEPVWFHIRPKNSDINIDFIAIRGTSSPLDALQDISLFLEITTFQLLSWVFPFLSALPDSFVRTIIDYASLPEGWINEDARISFGDEIYEYCHDLLSSYENDTGSMINGTDFHTTNLFLGKTIY